MQEDFEAFYLRHFKAIYCVCYAFMKNAQDAEDCTEDTVRGGTLSLRRGSGYRRFSAIISTARLGIKSPCPPSPLRRSQHGTSTRTEPFLITTGSMKRTASMSANTLTAATSTRCF